MKTPLFVEKPMVKAAVAAKKLSADPQAWQEDIIQFLLSEHPYLNDYNIELEIKTAIPENGTLFGTIMVSPRVSGQPTLNAQNKPDFAGIPVFAENWKLRPLDVFSHGGQFQPLTENRMRAVFPLVALGTPAATPGTAPSSINLSSFAMSPVQTMTGYDFGNTPGSTGSVKMSSLARQRIREFMEKRAEESLEGRIKSRLEKMANQNRPSLLDEIRDTVDLEDAERFVTAAGSPECAVALVKNAAFREVCKKIDTFELADPLPGMEDVARASIEPTVMQVRHHPDGTYTVKSASAAVYDPIVRTLSPREFDELPSEVKAEVIKKGHWTHVTEYDQDLPNLEIEGLSDLLSTGTPFVKCAVFDHETGRQEGVLLPAVTNIGTQRPIYRGLWLGEAGYAVLEKVAGVQTSTLNAQRFVDVVGNRQAGGHGTFVYLTKAANCDTLIPLALEPMTVRFSARADGGTKYSVVTDSGRSLSIVKTAGARALFVPHDNSQTIFIPEEARWIPLDNEVHLEKEAALVKEAMQVYGSFVKVASNGTRYSIEGDACEAVPLHDRCNVDRTQALFVMGLMGVKPEVAGPYLDKAAKLQAQTVRVAFDVEPKEVFEKYASDIASEFVEAFRKIRKPGAELIKAAANALQDTTTLDALLSLGFLNPQNVEIFINHLPHLEETLGYISELLVASRLGFGVDETSLKTCMTALDDIISDLQFISNESASQFTPSSVGSAGTSFLPVEGVPSPQPQPQSAPAGGGVPGQQPGGGAQPPAGGGARAGTAAG